MQTTLLQAMFWTKPLALPSIQPGGSAPRVQEPRVSWKDHQTQTQLAPNPGVFLTGGRGSPASYGRPHLRGNMLAAAVKEMGLFVDMLPCLHDLKAVLSRQVRPEVPLLPRCCLVWLQQL